MSINYIITPDGNFISEDELYHYGVLGMKWGVRRYQNKDGSLTNKGKKHYDEESYTLTTKSGEQIKMVRNHCGALAKSLRKISPKIAKEQDKTLNYKVYDSNGKRVGSYQAYLKSPEEFNIVWTDTKKQYRGRGYTSAVLKQGEEIAKKYGRTKITAELVDSSPDIHHIAREKQGYVKVGEIRTQDVLDTWGGLTLVEKRL